MCDLMKRTIFRVLIFSFAFGCVVTAVSPLIFVYESEDVHSQFITYERGLPFPYIIETAQVPVYEQNFVDELCIPPGPRAYTVGQEILTIPLLSSVLSNTVAVAGIIGILMIRAQKSSVRIHGFRDV